MFDYVRNQLSISVESLQIDVGVNESKNCPNSFSWVSIKVTCNSFCLTLQLF